VATVQRSDGLAYVRAALIGRAESCWNRLEDVVSELCSLHGANAAAIVEHVRAIIAAEETDSADIDHMG
jgi:hypothetical protein